VCAGLLRSGRTSYVRVALLLREQKTSSQNPKHLKQIARDTSSAERTRHESQAKCNAQHMQSRRRKFYDLQARGVGWGAPLKGEGREGWVGAGDRLEELRRLCEDD
jgi:hypothetical protein